MSSREPMWFCYECNAEMRPLMAPDPHCASCNGTFVEKIENPEDDPRAFAQSIEDGDEPPDLAAFAPMLRGLSSIFAGGPAGRAPSSSPRNPGQEGQPAVPRASPFGGSGFTFQMSSSSNGNTRSWSFGGPNTIGGSGNARSERPGLANMSSFMRRSDSSDMPGTPGEIAGPVMAQYLMALLSGMPHGRGGDGEDPFGGMFGPGMLGPENGRWGDYAFSQEALDQIMTEIMENSNAHRPVPAPDETIDKLPREVLEDGSPLLEKDCAVCKEQFSVATQDPDELVIITLPCKHPFHQDCILPWLKSSGTCPVCRYQLVAQPEHQDTPQPGTSQSQPGSNPSARGPTSPGVGQSGSSDSSMPNIFESIMGYIRSSQSGHDDGHGPTSGNASRSNTSRNAGGASSDNPTPPGGWSDQID